MDGTCHTQSYVDPEVLGNLRETYDDFPRDTVSCGPSCDGSNNGCLQNPYGQNDQDPKWLNGRFWNRQETFPGIPGLGNRYPTPNMIS
jgi:hypothetical protein